jgi:predicted enzyme related to lactoylglutathione lyase
MGAPVTWFEINTNKPTAVREFYADLFGWKLQVLEEANYALVDTGT